MSEIFFKTLNIPAPDINLDINDVSRGTMIGEMIKKIDFEFNKHAPDMVILFGDTNSTLAGAVAASSYQCEIVHVEAGLRSYNKLMPEEHNRIVADHLSTILCVTSPAEGCWGPLVSICFKCINFTLIKLFMLAS